MSDENHNQASELNFTDRVRWEKGKFVPRTLNKAVVDVMTAMAYEQNYTDQKKLDSINIEFPTGQIRMPDKKEYPAFMLEMTGHNQLYVQPFRTDDMVAKLRAYVEKNFPDSSVQFQGTDSVKIVILGLRLRDVVDVLVKGVMEPYQKEHGMDFPVEFVKIMEAAAPKTGVNYQPGSKDWNNPDELEKLSARDNKTYMTNDDYYGTGKQIGMQNVG